MQAYEFYAMPEDGTIKIPEKFRSRIKSGVKVILLEQASAEFNDDEMSFRKRTDFLSPISIDTRGWKFDREEANER